jgi:hypothetical protein
MTVRPIATLTGLFAPGQAPLAITPDRVQDVIDTLRGGWGRISLTTPSVTVIAAQNEWTKVADATALGGGALLFDMPENNRLRYTGTVPARVEVAASLDLVNGNNTTFEAAVYVNGAILLESVHQIRLGSGGAVETAVILADFQAVTGDYAELWVRNLTDASDVTATRLYMRARSYVL